MVDTVTGTDVSEIYREGEDIFFFAIIYHPLPGHAQGPSVTSSPPVKLSRSNQARNREADWRAQTASDGIHLSAAAVNHQAKVLSNVFP
jgi:hypothetical protein